VKFIWVR